MEDPNDISSFYTETSAERQHCDFATTSSKDTNTPEDNVSLDELNTKAIEVNSADEVRYLIPSTLPQSPHSIIHSIHKASMK